jgi:hypothetical protein
LLKPMISLNARHSGRLTGTQNGQPATLTYRISL